MEATNGLGVILENRYYGKSYPFNTSTTDELRFLTTEQSRYHFIQTNHLSPNLHQQSPITPTSANMLPSLALMLLSTTQRPLGSCTVVALQGPKLRSH